MSRLVRVELRRFFARRLTQVGTAAALVITGLLLFAVWQDSKPLPADELRQQRVQFEAAQRDWQVNGARMVADCKAEQARQQEAGVQADLGCDQIQAPIWEQWGKPETRFTEAMPDFLLGLAYLTAFAAFLIGAGFMGAEFSSGSIGNWLTFEPRRLKVYGSKLIAAAAGPVPMAVGLLVVMTAGCWLIIDHNGTTAGTTARTWGDLGGIGGRGVVLAAAAGVVGVAIGGLLRHTAAAIGVAMAYLVIVEGVFGHALQKLQPWLINVNFAGWIKHGTTYFVEECRSAPDGGYFCDSVEKPVTFAHSATYLGVLMAVLLVVAAVVFRRRDIT